MVTTGELLGRINPYNNKKKVIVENQSTNDIIKSILDNHKKYIYDYKNISSFFKGSNNYQTGKNIFNYLKKNIRYKIDSADEQLIKSPAAILATKEADCKMYSNFAAGILDNLKIPFVFRFAGYSAFDNQPAHVFIVINPGKNEIWLDPVLKEYNYKKPYNFKIDKKMAVIAVSGIGKAGKGKAKVKKFLKKGAKVIIKVAATPARNAFLLLVKLNFTGLGTKLSTIWASQPSKLQKLWEGTLGGKMKSLKKAFETGKGKKRIFGHENSYIGTPAVTAAVASAAPIIAKVASFLKSVGIDANELVDIGKKALNEKAKALVTKKLMPKVQEEAEDNEIANDVIEQDKPAAIVKPAPGNKMLPLYLLGGAAVIYLIAKKK